jgi:hypothetical protein
MDYVAPERVASFRTSAQAKGGGFRMTPIPAEVFNINPQDRAWVNRQCVDHPLKCFEQKLRLTGAWTKVSKRVYVYALGWSPSSFTPFYERLQRDPAWHTVSVLCGHEVMLDRPQELTQILLDAL